MAVLRCFKDPCDQPFLGLILMGLILRTGNTLNNDGDSSMKPNEMLFEINSFGFNTLVECCLHASHAQPAYFGEFAHMAAIGWSQPEGSTLWNCGGSLIWGNYILTAAHCAADRYGIAPDVVRLGDLNLYDTSDDGYVQQRKIVEIIRHPYHVFSMKYHDIALMRLDTRLTPHYLHTHGLRAGLQDNQICAGDIKMDTCPSIIASNGAPTILGEFAHMAAIGWKQPDRSLLWNCGGSLISVNYILTAAHCSKDINLREPTVARLGDINLYDASDDEHAQQRDIIEIKIHPNYVFRNKYHDIALMRLDRSVTVHDTVVPICLWNKAVSRSNSFEAVGWGETSFRGMRSPFLVKVRLSLVGKSKCSKHYLYTRGLGAGLHENQMCAGDEIMDTCPGDSGGPLQVKHYFNELSAPFLVGVTSFGAACGLSAPGVYTKVAPYIPWITSTLKSGGEYVPG
ncbi:serine protease snake-like [Anopheles ziemanni]|uniref:serine protease snake-like n=1 Tax=Anopheles ziemanni TaxID=345580 RepID=UPI002660139F|nr:serine protease snake-like [Anopheles ziemanni]